MIDDGLQGGKLTLTFLSTSHSGWWMPNFTSHLYFLPATFSGIQIARKKLLQYVFFFIIINTFY